MKRFLCCAALYLATASAAIAGYAAMGAGTTTCTQFNEQYAKDPRLVETVYFSWALGFISGLNETLLIQQKPTHDMQSIPLQQQKDGIRAFCAAQPSKLYEAAVIELFNRMGRNAVPTRSAPRGDSPAPPKN